MFLHHLHTQASFVSDLLIRPAFTGEASHFLLARRESCEVRESRVSGWRPICSGSAHLFALNEKIRRRESDGVDVRDGDRYSQMVPFRVMKGFLRNCWLSCVNSGCFFPTSLEPATTIKNLIRNRPFGFQFFEKLPVLRARPDKTPAPLCFDMPASGSSAAAWSATAAGAEMFQRRRGQSVHARAI